MRAHTAARTAALASTILALTACGASTSGQTGNADIWYRPISTTLAPHGCLDITDITGQGLTLTTAHVPLAKAGESIAGATPHSAVTKPGCYYTTKPDGTVLSIIGVNVPAYPVKG